MHTQISFTDSSVNTFHVVKFINIFSQREL